LLGIDTPEKGEPFYGEARQYLRALILNQELRYQYGPEATDRYGRTLAFLYAGSTFVNAELVRAGLARAYIFSDNLLLSAPAQAVCEAQREALAARRRIWSLRTPRLETRYFGNANSMRFHRPDCSSIRNSDTLGLVRVTVREELLLECYSPCRNCDP
jgi:endonuclease YncB( thermonuclease family)